MGIAYTVLKIVGGIIVVTLWGYSLYMRGGYRDRKHKADVQTLFSVKK
jgi:hypothetical protein